jgi:long-chain acyl-CoA synthetase
MAAVALLLSVIDDRVIDEAHIHTYLGYLPLAHSLEFVGETFMFSAGVKIGYGTSFTLLDSGTAIKRGDKGDVSLLKPTVMPAVPLILDRIRKTIFDKLEKRGPFAKEIFNYAMAYKTYWGNRGFETPIVNRLFCKAIRAQIGGNLQYMLVGGAPLSPDTQKIMKACLNIKLLQV